MPCKPGPTTASAVTAWHDAQLFLKIASPFAASWACRADVNEAVNTKIPSKDFLKLIIILLILDEILLFECKTTSRMLMVQKLFGIFSNRYLIYNYSK